LSGLDIGIIVFYMAGMLFIGIYSGKKQQDSDDYFVAGRKAGVFSITCLWLSSWIGGASIVGTAERAYSMGITAVWYVVVIAVSLVIFAFTFTGTIKRLSTKLNLLTYPDFIESRYDSKTRMVATICTILGMIGFVASQFLAGGSTLSALTGWDSKVSLIVVAAVITFYTAFGGLLAVTYTDWVQTVILLLGIVILGVPLSIMHMDGGISAIQSLPDSYMNLGAWGWPSIIALGLTTLFSFYTNMDGYTRCIAAKDVKTSRRGSLLAAAGIFIIAVSATFLGLSTKVIMPDLPDSRNALSYLIIHIFPQGLRGIVVVGIIAAIMSSADILMLTASTNLTKDIYQRYINRDVTDKKIRHLSTCCSFGIGFVALLFAMYRQDIIDVLFIALTINSAGLFLPTVLGVCWKKANSSAAFYSAACSLAVVLFWFLGNALKWGKIFETDSFWPGLAVSALLFFPISIWGRQTPEEKAKLKVFQSAGKQGGKGE
jgi:SSS family solute:Na+ symporter